MNIELNEEEATFIMNILYQINIPLKAPDGLQQYMTGRSVVTKLEAVLKAPETGFNKEGSLTRNTKENINGKLQQVPAVRRGPG